MGKSIRSLAVGRLAGVAIAWGFVASAACENSTDRLAEPGPGTGGAMPAGGSGASDPGGRVNAGAGPSGGTSGGNVSGGGSGATGGASGAAAGSPGSGGTTNGGAGAGGTSGEPASGGLAGEAPGEGGAAGESPAPPVPSDLLCGRRPGGAAHTDNVLRFEDAAGSIVVQIERLFEATGLGFSAIYGLGAFDLSLDGSPVCISGESLAYTNTHHNSNDVAEADEGAVHYELIFDVLSADGPDYRLLATDSDGATLIDEALLPTGGPNACWRCSLLRFSELMVNNVSTYADESGEFEPWIEIYNEALEELDLTGLTLSNDFRDRGRWAFPPIAVPAQGVVIVFADGEPEEGPLHTSFALSPDGGELVLTWPDGTTDGGVVYGPMPEDASFAVNLAVRNSLMQTDAPTPGSFQGP